MQKLKGAIMNNLETNALRSAELMGYEQSKVEHVLIRHRVGHNKKEILEEYYSYNGLMPIVFECNSVFASNVSHEIEISRYFVRIHIADLNQSADVVPEIDSYSFDYNTEPEFIEALQLACIKYLELKNG